MKDEIFQVEPTGENTHSCDCCDSDSRTVWGFIHTTDTTVATYFAHWTVSKITTDHPGNFDLILGPFDENSTSANREAVAMQYALINGGEFMVIDAATRRDKLSSLAEHLLPRAGVIGKPIAQHAFDLADAVMLQDRRVFKDGPYALFA